MQWSGALPPRTEQLSTLSDGTHTGGRDSRLQHLLTSLLTLRVYSRVLRLRRLPLCLPFSTTTFLMRETYEGLQGT